MLLLDGSKIRIAGAFVALAALGAVGCNGKDAEKCTQAQGVIRQALTTENFDGAKQWREYAYKQCADQAALASLDKEISDREVAAKAQKDAVEKKKQETASLLKAFVDFAGQNRAAPDHASAAPVCDAPPASPTPLPAGQESKDRFCTATRQLGTFSVQVRYWQADPTAFRFVIKPDDPGTCDALGGTIAKSWDVAAQGGASAKRHRCDLGGALAGLQGVVSDAAKAEVSVFSPQYLDRDPGMRVILQGP